MKKPKHSVFSLLLALTLILGSFAPTLTYAAEISTPGGDATSNAVLDADALILNVTVPTSVLIHVDSAGVVTTPDYLPIINNSVAPVFIDSLSVTTENDWTLDPTNNDYSDFKVNQKNYWLSFNDLDPSSKPIALATPISGSGSLNLVLSAGVAPQRTAINALNIGEIVITLDWDAAEGAEEVNQDFNFEVHSVDHGVGGFLDFNMTVEAPGMASFAVLPAGSQPPQNGPIESSIHFNLDYAGTQTQGVPIFDGYDDSIDYDIYVWTYDADWYPVGPVKAHLPAKASEGSEGEYVMATDADFSGEADGEFKYIGSNPYVAIPHVIKGVPVTSYNCMFWINDVKGVASDNENITDMSSMFSSSKATTLDLTNLDTSGVTGMAIMFQGSQATTLDLSNFDTSDVTNMAIMFADSQATTLDLTGWDVSKIIQANEMFKNTAASNIVLSGLDFKNLSASGEMFAGVDLDTLAIKGTTRGAKSMFEGATINTLDLTEFVFTLPNSPDTVESLYTDMFKDATIGTLYVRDRDQAELINQTPGKPAGLKPIIKGQPALPEGYALALDRDFDDDNKFTYLYFDSTRGEFIQNYYPNNTAAYRLRHNKFVLPHAINGDTITSYSNMFSANYYAGDEVKLATTFLSGNSGITDMSFMFQTYPTTALNLDLDTSNVTTMEYMFAGAKATSLDLSGFNTNKVQDMSGMFRGSEATTIDLSTFNTVAVTNAEYMFQDSTATTIDISSFNLALNSVNVTNIFKDAAVTTVYVSSQDDIDYLDPGDVLSETINFIIK